MEKKLELISVEEKDAKVLTDSIVEVDVYRELYGKAVKDPNYSGVMFRNLLSIYVKSLQNHKELWKRILMQYVGEEKTLYYRDMYKFDTYKKVIFLPQVKETKAEE